MDNVFEILIYLFIIISFVSSFLKKKQKPAPPKTRPQVPVEEEASFEPETQMQTEKVEEYDILKELEQFFKVGEKEQPKPRVEPHQVPQPVKYEPKSRTVDDSWLAPTSSEHVYENTWDKRREEMAARKKEIESRSSVKADKFEQMLLAKKSSKPVAQTSLKNKLKQRDSLKEYIVISEILGKPKAYRR